MHKLVHYLDCAKVSLLEILNTFTCAIKKDHLYKYCKTNNLKGLLASFDENKSHRTKRKCKKCTFILCRDKSFKFTLEKANVLILFECPYAQFVTILPKSYHFLNLLRKHSMRYC